MFDVVLVALLVAFSALSLVKTWRRSIAWTSSKRPSWWQGSERTWLGLQAGQALTPIWLGTGGLAAFTSGPVSEVALVAFVVTTLLSATVFLLGLPSFLMPPAFRGSFRGWLRM